MKQPRARVSPLPPCCPAAEHAAEVPPASAEHTVVCYQNEIPTFVAAELDRLYQNPYASLLKMQLYGSLEGVSTYVVLQAGSITTLYLFRLDGSAIRVLNELIRLTQVDLQRFSDWVFRAIASAQVIVFKAVRTDTISLARPLQRHEQSEDIVVSLPATRQDYRDRLGKSTRKGIKRYTNKLLREHPDFVYRILATHELSEPVIRSIIALACTRLQGKRKNAGFTESEIQRVVSMCHRYGMVGVASVDGKICAGTITYRVGCHYYFQVTGHDAEFDHYSLGNLVSYMALNACIDEAGVEGHFLWGEYDFKYALLGVKRPLHRLLVYRSMRQQLRHAGLFARTAMGAWVRQARALLRHALRAHRPLNHTVAKLYGRFRPGNSDGLT